MPNVEQGTRDWGLGTWGRGDDHGLRTIKKQMKLRAITIIFLVVLGNSCGPYFGPDWQPLILPETPVNLEEFNSEYDDYNSDIPQVWSKIPFVFSSNRSTNGGRFDFEYIPMCVFTDRRDGIVEVTTEMPDHHGSLERSENIREALEIVNGGGNEFGPLFIPVGRGFVRDPDYREFQHYLFLYATDAGGNLDIQLTHNHVEYSYIEPIDLKIINTSANEAYPTIVADSLALYFCSDKTGVYDIYKTDLVDTMDFLSNITSDTPRPSIQVEALSSGSDDKCPRIYKNLMVFTSNRPGGYGAYDLYYSNLLNGSWSDPINFGPEINTEFDEYRPIVVPDIGYRNLMMIFSSNRPGGQGGFDLYYVGIPKDL